MDINDAMPNFYSCITTEGRKLKYNEPSYVASVRLPVSMRQGFNEFKQQYNIAKELQNVMN
ncbi:hypothetical protein, partial [Aeromonas lacus]|uniref:hypothetical protein n=1 Tax=Aeromonas lacus TaxID=558884 RepID=UPI00051C735B